MRLFCFMLAFLFSTEVSPQKNILDFLEQKPDVKTEQKILRQFKESDCYKKGANPKIQPHYSYMVQPYYLLKLKRLDETVLTNKSLFLKNLRKGRKPHCDYTIFNDSLQKVADYQIDRNRKHFYCNYLDKRDTYNAVFQYAIKNQYLLFFVNGFDGNIHFGYKDGHLIVFEIKTKDGGHLEICPFEEFDWDQPYLLPWKRVMIYGLPPYELQWREKNELTKSLYLSLENFVKEESYSRDKAGGYNSLWELFTRKKKQKRDKVQKQIKQQEVKNFLESHFIFYDTVPELVFFDKSQILEWGRSFGAFAYVQSEEFNVKDSNIFILMIDKCSGVRCLSIYVFEQEGENWKLMTGTNTGIREKINIRVDNEQDKIVFETESIKIGELHYR